MQALQTDQTQVSAHALVLPDNDDLGSGWRRSGRDDQAHRGPAARALISSSAPPSSSARSAIPARPNPVGPAGQPPGRQERRPGGPAWRPPPLPARRAAAPCVAAATSNPVPSSLTSRTTRSFCWYRRIRTDCASACLAAFCSASCAVRYTAVSRCSASPHSAACTCDGQRGERVAEALQAGRQAEVIKDRRPQPRDGQAGSPPAPRPQVPGPGPPARRRCRAHPVWRRRRRTGGRTG